MFYKITGQVQQNHLEDSGELIRLQRFSKTIFGQVRNKKNNHKVLEVLTFNL